MAQVAKAVLAVVVVQAVARAVVVVQNVNVSISFAISAASPTPFLLSHSQAGPFCAVIVLAPAARRIAELRGVRVPTLVGPFLSQKNPTQVGL